MFPAGAARRPHVTPGQITVYCSSHSSTRDVWPLFFGQLRRFWPAARGVFTADATVAEAAAAGLGAWTFVPHANEAFVHRYAAGLRAVQTPYVLTMLEDFLLLGRPDLAAICAAAERAFAGGAHFLRLIRSAELDDFSHQATVWRTRSLQALYAAAADAPLPTIWDAEPALSAYQRALGLRGVFLESPGARPRGGHADSPLFPYVATGLTKGRWNLGEYPELAAILDEYGVDPAARGVDGGETAAAVDAAAPRADAPRADAPRVAARGETERVPARTTLVTAIYELDRDGVLGGRSRATALYFPPLRAIARMGAPLVVYTWPHTVDAIRRFLRAHRITADVIGFELADAPHFLAIQALRAAKDYRSMLWRDRCHALCLTKPWWLAEQARRDPFDSERFYWIDAGLSYDGLFPRCYLASSEADENGLLTPALLAGLAAVPGMLVFGINRGLDVGRLHNVPVETMEALAGGGRMSTHVIGGLFGGPREAIAGFHADYDVLLTRVLDAGELGTEENVLSMLVHRDPARFTVASFTTWHHEDSGALRPPDGEVSFYHALERLVPVELVGGGPAVHARRATEPADVTVVLNTYKRPHTLRPQYEAVTGQSRPPAEVMIWQNHPDIAQGVVVDPDAFDRAVLDRCVTAGSRTTNFGVWGRFAFALNARTRYVCVLDDDTVPGLRWLESCLDTIATHRGLLGTIGIVHDNLEYFGQHRRIGWCEPNEAVEEVDYVGHAWFFEREWLTAFWRELPDLDLFAFEAEPHALCAGEDMHFSYTLQKYLGLATYVPPHPAGDRSLWGSDPALAMRWGTDDAALSNLRTPQWKFDRAWASYRDRGFRFLCQRAR